MAEINRAKSLSLPLTEKTPEPEIVQVSPGALNLLDFVPRVTPRYERPDHLSKIAELFARADRGEEVRALVSVPPQHGKTELILHGCAWLLLRHSELPIFYVGYGGQFAQSKSAIGRDYARRAGVMLRDDSSSKAEWLTEQNGGMRAAGFKGGITGHPARLIIVDDPHKGREAAESASAREKVHADFTASVMPRLHPGGSVIVVHTRWHEEDLIGTLSKEMRPDGTPVWEVINLPAVKPDGSALWHQRPLAFLEEKRAASEYDWWSLWMGSPRPRGGQLFRGVNYYTELPQTFRIGKGCDLAYTAKTRADWSVATAMLQQGDKYFIAALEREQCEVPQFLPSLRKINAIYPGGKFWWYCSTTEKGLAQLSSVIDGGDVAIHGVLATADKYVRAQGFAKAWNDGRVFVPRNAPWLKELLKELEKFSGVGDLHDDQVDALAAAFASLPLNGIRSRAPRLIEHDFESSAIG